MLLEEGLYNFINKLLSVASIGAEIVLPMEENSKSHIHNLFAPAFFINCLNQINIIH